MVTEEGSLLEDRIQPLAQDIHNRFNRQQKRVILSVISLTGLVPMLIGSSFVPSIPQVSKDLNVTPADASLGVSLSVFASFLCVMFWSGYSLFYGRRPVYLAGLPFTALGGFAVAMSTNLISLLFWRFIQTFGCSSSFSIGAAIIGDVYKLEERGTAMGIMFGGMLLGLAIAPPIGGLLAQCWSWRGFQASLGVWALVQILLLALLLPETAHLGSLGVDKEGCSKRIFVWINPFRCLTFLRSPNIMAVGTKYGITSKALIGALILPSGLGSFLGSPIAGGISGMVVRRANAERKGEWVPEDRLRASWIGGLVLIPISVTSAGFTTTYIGGTLGLVINFVPMAWATYAVDIMPSRSSEVMAAIAAFRSLLLAPATVLLIPSVQMFGVAATNSIIGVLVLFRYFLIWLTMRYGKQMRAFANIGYPTFDVRVLSSDNNAVQN